MSDEAQMNAAWQAWSASKMPERTGYVYPLAGAFYECWKAAWLAAKERANG
jgi:hypothetical protein